MLKRNINLGISYEDIYDKLKIYNDDDDVDDDDDDVSPFRNLWKYWRQVWDYMLWDMGWDKAILLFC